MIKFNSKHNQPIKCKMKPSISFKILKKKKRRCYMVCHGIVTQAITVQSPLAAIHFARVNPCLVRETVQGAGETLTNIVSIIVRMGFTASCTSTI